MIIIAIYIYIISRTYSHITVQLELPLEEIYHLLFVSGSALVNRVTITTKLMLYNPLNNMYSQLGQEVGPS